MRTQSVDTHPEAEKVLVAMLRKAPVWKRFQLVQSLTHSILWANVHAWQESHHATGEQDAAIHVISSMYGTKLAQRTQRVLAKRENWHLHPADLAAIMLPLVNLFDELNVSHYLGGSIASSVYGMQQLAKDIDLVADLHEHMLPSLFALSRHGYLVDEDEVQQAFQAKTSFSLIHLDSLMKIDVILPKHDGFDIAMRPLVTQYILDKRYPPFHVASVNEMILFKLHRYNQHELLHTDGMHDDAEWNDILGMLKVQGPNLNLTLLEQWTKDLAIEDTWQQALIDSGLCYKAERVGYFATVYPSSSKTSSILPTVTCFGS